jgi:HEAT repeat protein
VGDPVLSLLIGLLALVALDDTQPATRPGQILLGTVPIGSQQAAAYVPDLLEVGPEYKFEFEGSVYPFSKLGTIPSRFLKNGGWSDLVELTELSRARQPVPVEWRGLLVIQERSHIVQTLENGIVIQRRGSMARNQIDAIKESVALASKMAEAYSGGKVRIRWDLFQDSDEERFFLDSENNRIDSEWLRNAVRLRVNSGEFEPEDRIYRGPYNGVLAVSPTRDLPVAPFFVENGIPVQWHTLQEFVTSANPFSMGFAFYDSWVRMVATNAAENGLPPMQDGIIPTIQPTEEESLTGFLPRFDLDSVVGPADWPVVVGREAARYPAEKATTWQEARVSPFTLLERMPRLNGIEVTEELPLVRFEGKGGEALFRGWMDDTYTPGKEAMFTYGPLVLCEPRFADLVSRSWPGNTPKPLYWVDGARRYIAFEVEGPPSPGPELNQLDLGSGVFFVEPVLRGLPFDAFRKISDESRVAVGQYEGTVDRPIELSVDGVARPIAPVQGDGGVITGTRTEWIPASRQFEIEAEVSAVRGGTLSWSSPASEVSIESTGARSMLGRVSGALPARVEVASRFNPEGQPTPPPATVISFEGFGTNLLSEQLNRASGSFAVVEWRDRGLVVEDRGPFSFGGLTLFRMPSGVKADLSQTPYLEINISTASREPLALNAIDSDGKVLSSVLLTALYADPLANSGEITPGFLRRNEGRYTGTITLALQSLSPDLRFSGLQIGAPPFLTRFETDRVSRVLIELDRIELKPSGEVSAPIVFTPAPDSEEPMERAAYAVANPGAGLKDANDLGRMSALRALQQRSAPDLVPDLIPLATVVNNLVGREAILALRHQDTPEANAAIRRVLEIGPVDPHRQWAAEALRGKADQRTIGMLASVLTVRSWRASVAAARTIAEANSREARQLLMAFLNNPDPVVREAVILAGPRDDDQFMRRVQWTSVNDPSDGVRTAAYLALIESGVARYRTEGWRGLRDDSSTVRRALIEAAQQAANPETNRLLIQSLSDRNPKHRVAALQALLANSVELAERERDALLADEQPLVVIAVLEAVARGAMRVPDSYLAAVALIDDARILLLLDEIRSR